MDKSATLADMTIRETLRPKSYLKVITTRSMVDLRTSILAARKFVLDDRMAGFLAGLQRIPFDAVSHVRRPQVLDTMRHGAMLPHPKTWIELSGKAFRRHLINYDPQGRDPWGNLPDKNLDVPERWGWLLEEHPRLPTVITMTEFTSADDGTLRVLCLPFTVVWNTQDLPLPWNDVDTIGGAISHGLMGYDCKQIGTRMTMDPALLKGQKMIPVQDDPEGAPIANIHYMIVETAGLCRYALALLSTLNDIPAVSSEVLPQEGYFSRGNYRKFVEHTTLRLNVPEKKNTRLLAKQVLAMARRRMHKVRGHWRLYLHGEGVVCTRHDHRWGAMDEEGHARCQACTAWRTWIAEHDRGDASLGVVTHDYAVTHEA